MGFSRQECWSGLPFPSPGDLPNLGIEPGSSALQADALTSEPPGKLQNEWNLLLKTTDNQKRIDLYLVLFSSVAQLCLTLCNSMDCSTPCFPVHHQVPEFTQASLVVQTVKRLPAMQETQV